MKSTHPSIENNGTQLNKESLHDPAEFSWTDFSLRLLELKMIKKKSGSTAEHACKRAPAGEQVMPQKH